MFLDGGFGVWKSKDFEIFRKAFLVGKGAICLQNGLLTHSGGFFNKKTNC